MKRADWILLAVVALASSIWCVTAGRQLGATFDEPFYFEGGLDYWRHGHFGKLLAAGVMPLPAHLQTLPIFIAEQTSGRALTVERDLGEMLRLARPVTLLFWLLLLASVMRLGQLFGGAWGGRAATLMVAAEPNFLAHASLATTDVALAACFAAFTAQWLAGRDATAAGRVLLPSIWFALALAAKVSAMALLPFAMVAAAVWHRGPWRRLMLDAIGVLLIGIALATLYCGTGGMTWLHGTLSRMPADHWLRPLVVTAGSWPLFPNALYAFWFQLTHNAAGQATYIAGVASTSALWFYVPLLLVIKLTVPMLVAVVFALAAASSRRSAFLIGAGLLAGVMIIFRVQTGIRFMLPLLALLIPWLGRHRIIALTAGGVMAIESILVWPDGLRYVNQLWGGARDGYQVVSDSNYDWGQGLPQLAQWQQADGRPMAIWYFGTDTRFPELVRYKPGEADDDQRVLDGRLLAVSLSLLYGGYLESPGPANDLIRRLRSQTPVAKTSTFFVFDRGY
ncbi:MAG TPA: hypothetical protein VEA16_10365 [Vicinamibacterales bacterium]|nr:hypothetical protein [Vicinamibacterales bacterium]